MESIGVCPPGVRDVLEREEIGPWVNGADRLPRVSAWQISLF